MNGLMDSNGASERGWLPSDERTGRKFSIEIRRCVFGRRRAQPPVGLDRWRHCGWERADYNGVDRLPGMGNRQGIRSVVKKCRRRGPLAVTVSILRCLGSRLRGCRPNGFAPLCRLGEQFVGSGKLKVARPGRPLRIARQALEPLGAISEQHRSGRFCRHGLHLFFDS